MASVSFPFVHNGPKLWLCAAAGLSAVYAGLYLLIYLGGPLAGTPAIFGDFIVFWAAAKLAAAGHAAEVYDTAAFGTYLAMLTGEAEPPLYPFAYPPVLLPLLLPLALLPLPWAYAVWAGTGFAALVWALPLSCRHPLPVFAVAVAPGTLVALVAGQNGLLTAALIVGALSRLTTRPAVTGVLLGLLCCKPQLGLLLPVVVLAARGWRAVPWAAGCVAAMAVAATAVCGPGIWAAWAAMAAAMPGLTAAHIGALGPLMPTVTAALLMLDMSWAAALAQPAAAVAAALVLWRLFRHRPADPAAWAAAMAAAFLATPFAYCYDMALLAPAVAMILTGKDAASLSRAESMALALAWAAPAVIPGFGKMGLPIGPLLLATVFAVLAVAVTSRPRLGPPAFAPPAPARFRS